MPLQPCPIPTIGPNCEQSYAEAAGNAYTIYQGIFLTISLILFLLATIQNIRLFRARGVKRQDYISSVPHQLFALSWFVTITLVIRGTDPHGWARRIPQWLEEFCLAMSTAAIYNMLVVTVMSWIKIIHSISGRSPDRVERFEHVLLILMLIWNFIFSTLYSVAKPAYLYSTISLIFNMTLNVVVVAMGWWYGVRIFLHLSRYAASSSSHGHHRSPSSSHVPPANKGSSTLRADQAKVRVIIHLMIWISIVSVIAITFEILTVKYNLRTQYQTAFQTWDYPTFTAGNILLVYASFPIGQSLSVAVCLFFFRKLRTSDTPPSKQAARDLTDEEPKDYLSSPKSSKPTPRTRPPSHVKQMSTVELGATTQPSSQPDSATTNFKVQRGQPVPSPSPDHDLPTLASLLSNSTLPHDYPHDHPYFHSTSTHALITAHNNYITSSPTLTHSHQTSPVSGSVEVSVSVDQPHGIEFIYQDTDYQRDHNHNHNHNGNGDVNHEYVEIEIPS